MKEITFDIMMNKMNLVFVGTTASLLLTLHITSVSSATVWHRCSILIQNNDTNRPLAMNKMYCIQKVNSQFNCVHKLSNA